MLAGMFLGVATSTGLGLKATEGLTLKATEGITEKISPNEELEGVGFVLAILGVMLFVCAFIIGAMSGWNGIMLWFLGATSGLVGALGFVYVGIVIFLVGELMALFSG